jgi:hypothetical protein
MTTQSERETAAAGEPVSKVSEKAATGTVETLADASAGDVSVTMGRLEDQLLWYDRRAKANQRWYQRLKVVQLLIAAAIPVVAAFGAGADIAGLLGALVVIVEGLQQLFQFQQNWLRYRATAQSLESEKHLYLAAAGPYSGARRPTVLLAERVEELLSSEISSWTTDQREASAAVGSAQGR